MSQFKSKPDLIVTIRAVAQVINGKVPNGKDASFASDFRTSRYAIILLAALADPLLEDHPIQIQNFTCVNFYRLDRVAKLCDLSFERTSSAEKVYRDLESRQKVKFFKQGNQTFVTFTKQGHEMSTERLKRFEKFANHLKSFPSLQDRYTEKKRDRGAFLPKGIRIKPRELIDAELIADELIKTISDWQ